MRLIIFEINERYKDPHYQHFLHDQWYYRKTFKMQGRTIHFYIAKHEKFTDIISEFVEQTLKNDLLNFCLFSKKRICNYMKKPLKYFCFQPCIYVRPDYFQLRQPKQDRVTHRRCRKENITVFYCGSQTYKTMSLFSFF